MLVLLDSAPDGDFKFCSLKAREGEAGKGESVHDLIQGSHGLQNRSGSDVRCRKHAHGRKTRVSSTYRVSVMADRES